MSSKHGITVANLMARGTVQPKPDSQRSTQFDPPPPSTHVTLPKPGTIIKMRLDMLDDSPYQVRLKISEERLDEVGQSMDTAGQMDPIEARIKPDGRGEIIKGHTRKYSGLRRGWIEADVLVVERSDRDARRAVMIDNIVDTPRDYEWARAFRAALDAGDARNQTELGEMACMKQSGVSRCLSMLALPAPIIALLEEKPGLFNATTAVEIQSLWRDFPNNSDVIIEGIKQFEFDLPQKNIRAWVTQKINQAKARNNQSNRRIIPFHSGATAYVTMAKGRDITLRLSDASLDIEEERKALEDFIRKRAEERSENKINK